MTSDNENKKITSESEIVATGETIAKPKKLSFVDKYIYRPSVYFILVVEFCERFGFYALTAILIIFFTSQLGLSNSNAVIAYHAFSLLGYFTPIIGAIVSDDYLGRYKTILVFGSIYAFGCILLAVFSIPDILSKVTLAGPIVALILIMLGTGGIKPCVSTFGADQFLENEQHKIDSYFSIFYMSINIGSILSFIISPLLRSKVRCFNGDCYFLAFGLPAILMLIALALFGSGTKYYQHKPNEGNAIKHVSKVTFIAFRERIKNYNKKDKRNFFDWAQGFVEPVFISDTKCLFRILSIFITIPMFWALFNQKGSLWTLQAIRMSGYIGPGVYMIPDQMQVVNPLLIVILLPIIDSLYALLRKFKVEVKPLRKIFAGMFISGFAFLISGGLEIIITKGSGIKISLSQGTSGVQFYNELNFRINITAQNDFIDNSLYLEKFSISEILQVNTESTDLIKILKGEEPQKIELQLNATNLKLQDEHFNNIIIYSLNGESRYSSSIFDPEVDSSGAKIRFLFVPYSGVQAYEGFHEFNIKFGNKVAGAKLGVPTEFFSIPFGSDDAVVENVGTIPLNYVPGGVYTIIVRLRNTIIQEIESYENVSPSSYHMLLQVPQYIIITIGEVLISVTGLSFAYDQSPKRIKVALTGAWLLTSAFGNLIVIIIESAAGESIGSTLPFVFAGLMFVVSFIFAVISYYYKPYNPIEVTYSVSSDEIIENK